MKCEMEMKEQEKKKNQKVEFVTGGTRHGVVAQAPKINIPIPGASTVAAGGLHPVPGAVDFVARDGRQNYKSKWDKVDGDRRNLRPPGGQDSVSATGAHAAFLSAANAGCLQCWRSCSKCGYNTDFYPWVPHVSSWTGLVASAIAAGLGALTNTLSTLVLVIGASGFATAAAVTTIRTVVGSFR